MYNSCFNYQRRNRLRALCKRVKNHFAPFGLDQNMVFKEDLMNESYSYCEFTPSVPLEPLKIDKSLPTIMLIGIGLSLYFVADFETQSISCQQLCIDLFSAKDFKAQLLDFSYCK